MTNQSENIIEKFKDEDWEELLEGIRDGNCVVCVGPQILASNPEVSFEEELADDLRKNAQKLKIKVYENGWYWPEGDISSPYRSVKKFYKNKVDLATGILHDLARIPFPLYINLIPTDTMNDAFKGIVQPFYDLHKFNVKNEKNYTPTKEKPLVFNLLGNIDIRETVVLTYDDFYEYLKSILNAQGINQEMIEILNKADYFLFIGMPFDQWYMHLLIRIILHNKKQYQTAKFGVPMPKTDVEKFHGEFKIRFCESEIKPFIEQLFLKCEEAGILRKVSPVIEWTQEKVIELCHEAERCLTDLGLPQFFEFMDKKAIGLFLNGEDLRSQLKHQGILYKQQYRDSLRQILPSAEFNSYSSKTIQYILEILNDLKTNWTK